MPNLSGNDFRHARKCQTFQEMTFATRGNVKPPGKRLSPSAEMPNHSEKAWNSSNKPYAWIVYTLYSAEEKEAIVLSVKRSELSIVQALKRLGIPRRTFYNWYQKYATGGVNALRETPCRRQTTWNQIPDHIRQIAVELSLEHPELTPRELSVLLLEDSQIFVSAYSFYRIHGKPLHPQTQGKIERYHRSMKNVIKLNHYFCPSELEKAIDGWVKYYNERRFHESLDNLTPRDVYLGQGEEIKRIRETIKQNSINKRIFDNKTTKYQSK